MTCRDAHDEARSAPIPETAGVHKREAAVHERAVKLHEDAVAIQRRHEEEHADDGRDQGERGSDG